MYTINQAVLIGTLKEEGGFLFLESFCRMRTEDGDKELVPMSILVDLSRTTEEARALAKDSIGKAAYVSGPICGHVGESTSIIARNVQIIEGRD